MRTGPGASVLLAGAVCLLALPSAVLAFTNRYEALPDSTRISGDTIMTGRIDPRLARSISVRTLARSDQFRFTPASLPSSPSRNVTVAVLSAPVARTILVQAAPFRTPEAEAPAGQSIAPMAYSLGTARGYKGFAPSVAHANPGRTLELPNLSGFDLKPSTKSPDPRFSPRISLDERANAGRAPRTFEGDGEQTVDVGGSYRVGRNIDVTAGVRYSQERDRLRPVDPGRQDRQSVYVGTQFRF